MELGSTQDTITPAVNFIGNHNFQPVIVLLEARTMALGEYKLFLFVCFVLALKVCTGGGFKCY